MNRTSGSGASRGGGDEFHNEDAFLVDEGLGLYVVCDGLSSRPAGERASKIAVQAVEEFVADAPTDVGTLLERSKQSRRVVRAALRHAIDRVLDAAREHPELEGMATTLTLLLADADRGVVGHVGDSRAVLIRSSRLHRLTVDHELTEELVGPNGGGSREGPPVETFELDLRANDTLILHTDGAENGLEDLDLSSIATTSPALVASRIVSAAHRKHPDVDATVVVVRVLPDQHRAWQALSEDPDGFSYRHRLATA